MTGDRERKKTFNTVAALYDEVRPGYPEPLVEDVIGLSGIGEGGRILEVGCGPGKATLPFARRGYEMLCLELGDNLARLAAANLAPYPHVTVENVAFEAWPLQANSFDLVISAEAWHWIAAGVGYARAAVALKEDGALALFWNQQPVPDTPFFRALVALYAEKAPEPILVGQPDPDGIVRETIEAIEGSGYFGDLAVRQYWWTAHYTAQQYIKLLQTYSIYHTVPQEPLQELFAAIRALIEEFGGVVERPYRAVLYVAQRR